MRSGVFMSSIRLAAGLLVLTSCAAWEVQAPNQGGPPPAESPVPSHYAPPPPGDPRPSGYVPPVPVDPSATPTMPTDRVAIAAVQLLEDCPDPPEAAVDGDRKEGVEADRQASQREMAKGYVPRCEQSTVQLAVRSDRSGRFRIEAVRVLDGAKRRLAGSAKLRQPTNWGDGQYQRWDERVVAGKDLQISYKLGALDLARGEALVGPDFNTMSGPFILELDVSIEGVRQTVRSPAFQWQRMDMVET
jgi:hypothetical protein